MYGFMVFMDIKHLISFFLNVWMLGRPQCSEKQNAVMVIKFFKTGRKSTRTELNLLVVVLLSVTLT